MFLYFILANAIQIGSDYHNVGANYEYNTTNSTEHTTIIQQAINDLNINDGGTVHIRRGEYIINENIELRNNLHFKGDGIDITILKLKNYSVSYKYNGNSRAGIIRIQDGHDVIISDLTIDGNKANQHDDEDHRYGKYGIFTEGTDDVLIDNIKTINCQGYGIDPHGWKSEYKWGYYLNVTNSISNENDLDGFTLDQTRHIFVDNCTAIHNGRHGFNVVTGSQFVTIQNSIAKDNGFYELNGWSGCGIMVQNNKQFGTNNVIIENNMIYHSKKAGICLKDVVDVYVANNNIEDSCTCLRFEYTLASIIEENICNTKKFNRIMESNLIYVSNNYDYNLIRNKENIYLVNNTFMETSCSN